MFRHCIGVTLIIFPCLPKDMGQSQESEVPTNHIRAEYVLRPEGYAIYIKKWPIHVISMNPAGISNSFISKMDIALIFDLFELARKQ